MMPTTFFCFISGVVFAYSTPLPVSTITQVTSVTCGCKNISLCSGHCVTSQDGVHDLDCFGTLFMYNLQWECVWKHGVHTVNRTFKLMIQPKLNKCKMFTNISRTSQIITGIVFKNSNLTAHVFDESDQRNCTKAVFRGSTHHLVRCRPRPNVHINRHARQLEVHASWRKDEKDQIEQYTLRYKELNSISWTEPPVQSKDNTRCIVGNLNSSLSYEVQIQCVTNKKCTQCPWGEVFTVPPELTDKPIIEQVKYILQSKGKRLVFIKWKFAPGESVEGYSVTVGKASGEPPSQCINTSRPEVRLTLSHSAYHLSIASFNSAGISPAANRPIPPMEDKDLAGKLNVTFNNTTSFNISWEDNLIETYSCYSVEWWRRGEKAAYKSFFEDENNYKVIPLEESLQPYQRYTFTLHTRPFKEPCNLKRINNSEGTYGSVQAYVTEGSPISAPGNLSSCNVSQSSLVMEWISIPEEDIKGFLLGYIIHYTESHQGGTDAETNITVERGSNRYELVDLKSSTVYRVHMSAFTSAGVGVRSSAAYFETKPPDSLTLGSAIAGLIIGVIVLIVVVHVGSRLFKRAKKMFWPSIPNPGNSNAIQKIDGDFELELFEPIKRQQLEEEEEDTNSLHIVERRTVSPLVSNLYSDADTSGLHHNSREQEDSHEASFSTTLSEPTSIHPTCIGLCPRDIGSTAGDREDGAPTANTIIPTSTDTRQADPVPIPTVAYQSPPLAFMSDYTTMELFQQAVVQCVPAITLPPPDAQAQASQPEDTDFTPTRPSLDYISQPFCKTVLPSQSNTSQPKRCTTVGENFQ